MKRLDTRLEGPILLAPDVFGDEHVGRSEVARRRARSRGAAREESALRGRPQKSGRGVPARPAVLGLQAGLSRYPALAAGSITFVRSLVVNLGVWLHVAGTPISAGVWALIAVTVPFSFAIASWGSRSSSASAPPGTAPATSWGPGAP